MVFSQTPAFPGTFRHRCYGSRGGKEDELVPQRAGAVHHREQTGPDVCSATRRREMLAGRQAPAHRGGRKHRCEEERRCCRNQPRSTAPVAAIRRSFLSTKERSYEPRELALHAMVKTGQLDRFKQFFFFPSAGRDFHSQLTESAHLLHDAVG